MVVGMFPHELTKGYSDPTGSVVSRVNGVAIRNLRHLTATLHNARKRFVEFEFAEKWSGKLVFDREEFEGAAEPILAENGIRDPCSPDLRGVWERKE